MFETSGVIDKAFYNKYIWTLYLAGITKSLAILWLCFIVSMIIFSRTFEEVFLGAVIGLLFLFAIGLFCAPKYKKIYLESNIECTGKPDYICTSHFEENELVVKNESTNSVIKLKYDSVVKLCKCKSVYFLFTKTGKWVPIFVENFTDDEKEELLKFLKNKLILVFF